MPLRSQRPLEPKAKSHPRPQRLGTQKRARTAAQAPLPRTCLPALWGFQEAVSGARSLLTTKDSGAGGTHVRSQHRRPRVIPPPRPCQDPGSSGLAAAS